MFKTLSCNSGTAYLPISKVVALVGPSPTDLGKTSGRTIIRNGPGPLEYCWEDSLKQDVAWSLDCLVFFSEMFISFKIFNQINSILSLKLSQQIVSLYRLVVCA